MTPIYQRIIDHAQDDEGLELAHKVWDPTTWVIDVRTGSPSVEDGQCKRHDMSEWMRTNIGRESWPIHDDPGSWHWAGATVDGWTWLGFATQDYMRAFQAAFPEETKDPS